MFGHEKICRSIDRGQLNGDPVSCVPPHPVYMALGRDAPERQAAYQGLVAAQLDPALLQDVRSCLQTGTPLGNDRFRLQIEQALGVRVGYSRRGRPKNLPAGSDQDLDQMDLDL